MSVFGSDKIPTAILKNVFERKFRLFCLFFHVVRSTLFHSHTTHTFSAKYDKHFDSFGRLRVLDCFPLRKGQKCFDLFIIIFYSLRSKTKAFNVENNNSHCVYYGVEESVRWHREMRNTTKIKLCASRS